MADCYLYVIRLPVGDYIPAYVGITKNPQTRFDEHCWAKKAFISRAIRACGKENVLFQIIESGDSEYILNRERETIAALNTRKNGYNILPGGRLWRGDILPSTRAKMSAAHRGRKRPPISEETRARISAAKRGMKYPNRKPPSPEIRARISAKLRGRKLSKEHVANAIAGRRGVKLSSEHLAKLIAGRRARGTSAETRAKLSAFRLGKPNPHMRAYWQKRREQNVGS